VNPQKNQKKQARGKLFEKEYQKKKLKLRKIVKIFV
jgi:hypothetical protein